MKNFFIGLMVGLVIAAVTGIIAIPGIKKTEREAGIEEGTKKGMAAGTTEGIAKGIEQHKAELEAKRQQDSAAAARKYAEAKRRAAMKPKVVERPVQNWHVENGKIADPIPYEEPKEEVKEVKSN